MTDRIAQRLRQELAADPEILRERERNIQQRKATEKRGQEEEQQHTCPVCYELMQAPRIPTMLFPCGHTFCKLCVKRHRKSNSAAKCPFCRTAIQSVAENHHLRQLIEAFAERKSVGGGPGNGGGFGRQTGGAFPTNHGSNNNNICSASAGLGGGVGGGGAAGARYLREYNMLKTRRRIMVQERDDTEAEARRLRAQRQRHQDKEGDLLAEERAAADAVARAKARLAGVRARIEEHRQIGDCATEQEAKIQAKLAMLKATISTIESEAQKAHVLASASKLACAEN